MDIFSKTSEGIRNTTTIAGLSCTGSRKRLPRNIASDGMIEAYSAEKAEGCFILYQLENGAYMSETYMFHIQLFGQVLLATRRYVFLLKRHHYDFSKIWRIDISSK